MKVEKFDKPVIKSHDEIVMDSEFGNFVTKTSFKYRKYYSLFGKTIMIIGLISPILYEIRFITSSPNYEWYEYIPYFLMFLLAHCLFLFPLLLKDFGFREISIYEKGIGIPTMQSYFDKREDEIVIPYEIMTGVEKRTSTRKDGKKIEKIILSYHEMIENTIKNFWFSLSEWEEIYSLIEPYIEDLDNAQLLKLE